MASALPAGVPRRRARACNPTAPRKRRRAPTCTPAPPSPPVTELEVVLPESLLLEIVARSDTRTLVRCAALCKPLRRAILSAAFRRRVTGLVVPPRLLGYLHTFDMEKEDEVLPDALFSAVHPDDPATPAAVLGKHLAPFVGRSAAELLGHYKPVTSRGGLAVLLRRNINRRKRSHRRSDMCVYNPVTGDRVFFPCPPDFWNHYYRDLAAVFVLLTAQDGITGSDDFTLLVANFNGFLDSRCTIWVETMSSSDVGTWSPVKFVGDPLRPWYWLEECRDAVVLRGGLIHWLANCGVILTYDVGTSKPGSIMLPAAVAKGIASNKLHLGTSPDGRLRLLAIKGFMVSVWLLLADRGRWELAAKIDTEAKLRSLCPEMPPPDGPKDLEFMSSGEKSGVALLRWGRTLIVLEVETGEMRKRKIRGSYRNHLLVEVDMPSKLQTMKAFS